MFPPKENMLRLLTNLLPVTASTPASIPLAVPVFNAASVAVLPADVTPTAPTYPAVISALPATPY
jgi:hypothetical protein